MKGPSHKGVTSCQIPWLLSRPCVFDGFATFGAFVPWPPQPALFLHWLSCWMFSLCLLLTLLPFLVPSGKHALSRDLHLLISLLTLLVSEVPSFLLLSFLAASTQGFPSRSCSLPLLHSHPTPPPPFLRPSGRPTREAASPGRGPTYLPTSWPTPPCHPPT